MALELSQWPLLRALSYLRRITIALESLARHHGTPSAKPRRKVEFSVASVEHFNQRYQEQQELNTSDEGWPT